MTLKTVRDPTLPSVPPEEERDDFERITKFRKGQLTTFQELQENVYDDLDILKTQVNAKEYASINAAVTSIGATLTTLLVSNAQPLTASLTIPSTLTLKIRKGGSIVKVSTYTLTINGPFEAGSYQVFSGFTYGDDLFINNSLVINPVWCGETGGQTLIGGTAATDILKLQGTSGDGTLTSPAIQLLVGNNGVTTAITVLNNGNVGIGTTEPLAPGGTAAKVLQLSGTEYAQYISETTSAAADNKVWRTIARNTQVFQIQTLSDAGGSEQTAMEIERSGNSIVDVSFPSGNVGIGTTDPGTNKLEVVGGPIKATGGLIIETRTDDPASPVAGQIWLRTDL